MTDRWICRGWVVAALVIAALALGCVRSVPPAESNESDPGKPAPVEAEQSEPSGEPPPAVLENRASELIEQAANIERVELIVIESRSRLGSFDAAGLERLRAGLAAGEVLPNYSNTSPPWPIALEIHVADRPEPFIAHPVGISRLRLNPSDPWSPMIADPATQQIDPRVREVEVGEPVFETIETLIDGRIEPDKEHQPDPKHDLSQFRVPKSDE